MRCAPRAPRKAAPACGLSAWPHHRVARPPGPRLRMAALWHRSLRAERWRGGDSVRSAIPYEQYQLARSRAITPVRWRKHAVPGQLIQRYGIAVSECSIASPRRGPTTVDESALENVTDQGRTCGRDPMVVDIDGHGSSRLSGPHRHVATTKTSQRVAEARSTADDGGRIVMWPGCSTSHMAMWLHEDARRFARMDPHGVTARPPRGCDRWSTRAAGRALPADR